MNLTRTMLVAIGLSCTTIAGWANPPARVGLWEISGKTGDGPRPFGAPQKVCITDETKKRGSAPNQKSNGCTSNTKWSGEKGVFEMTCENGRTGRGEFVYSSAEKYQGFIEFNDGMKPPTIRRTDIIGHWVSADCGNIKPILPAAAGK